MITGAHVIVYSTDPEADRVFLRDVLMLPHVNAGEGWLVFGLPQTECAVHPSEKNHNHELYLMCDDVESFIAEMKLHHIVCSEIQRASWGLLTHLTLPGGGRLGCYQALHARPRSSSRRAIRKPSIHSIKKIGGKPKDGQK